MLNQSQICRLSPTIVCSRCTPQSPITINFPTWLGGLFFTLRHCRYQQEESLVLHFGWPHAFTTTAFLFHFVLWTVLSQHASLSSRGFSSAQLPVLWFDLDLYSKCYVSSTSQQQDWLFSCPTSWWASHCFPPMSSPANVWSQLSRLTILEPFLWYSLLGNRSTSRFCEILYAPHFPLCPLLELCNLIVWIH